jgi:hypothetical protein
MKSASDKIQYDPEKVLNMILDLERRFPVNEWKVNGISFWPFIRTSLAYTQREFPKNKRNVGGGRYLKLLKTYGRISLLLPFYVLSLRLKLKSAQRIFVGAITHRVNIKGQKVNKYFDLAISDFNKNGNLSLIFDRGTSLEKSKYPNNNNWFSLPLLYVLAELLKRLGIGKKKSYNIELHGYSSFYSYLLENFYNEELLKGGFAESAMKMKMTNFVDRKELVKFFLKNSQVKNVYFLCYYSSLYYPLIAACKELGINTIDVQHGGMGTGHFSYDQWSRIPDEGYTMLPRYYWTWDDNSTRLVNAWALSTAFHKAFKMGTPWTESLSLISGYNPVKKNYILFNMTDSTLEPYIAATIRFFASEKQWVLRMHPRMMSKRDLLQNQINDHGFESFVSIEDSTEVLLADSLHFSSFFISASSGSIIEAVAMGFKPILLPSPGFNYYHDYIKSGDVLALHEKNSQVLVDLLAKAPVHRIANVNAAAKNPADSFQDFEQVLTSLK